MSDDTLIRIGDGVTQEWTLSPSNTGLTAVTVNGAAVAFTRPTWNKVRLDVAPAMGTQVAFTFTGTAPATGGSGDGGGTVTVDNTPVLNAVSGVSTDVAAVKTSVAAVKTAVDALGAGGGGGAVPGEVKLFSLTNGQSIPAGWALEEHRVVTDMALPDVYLRPAYVAGGANFNGTSGGTGAFVVNQGDLVFNGTTGNLAISNLSTRTTTTYSYPETYGQSQMPTVCSYQGGIVMMGGGSTTYPRKTMFKTSTVGVHTTLNSLPEDRTQGSAIELSGGRILLVGGILTSNVYSAELLLFTPGVGWSKLAGQSLEDAVAAPRLAKLPSGKIGIFSGVLSTGVASMKYYIFDPAALTRSAASVIPAQFGPAGVWDRVCLRTPNGLAYANKLSSVSDLPFCEFNEALGSFAQLQLRLPYYFLNQGAGMSNNLDATDLAESTYGICLQASATFMNQLWLVAPKTPATYRYLRKQ